MKLLSLLLLLLCVLKYAACGLNSTDYQSKFLRVLVVVSTNVNDEENEFDSNAVPKRERGEDILSGAEIAAHAINISTTILEGYHLKIVPIRVPMCNFNVGIVPFIRELLLQENNVIAVFGYFCDNLAKFWFSLIAHRNIIQIPFINAHEDLQLQHSMISNMSTTAKAVIDMIERLGWNQVGAVTVGRYHDTYYSRSLETFYRAASNSVNLKIMYNSEILMNQSQARTDRFFADLQHSGVKIVVNFLPPRETSEMICNAYLKGFRWPKYVWIYVDIDPEIEIQNSARGCDEHTMNKALESIITFHRYILQSDQISLNYSVLLNDSIWALALAVNASLTTNISHLQSDEISAQIDKDLRDLKFQGNTGDLNFSHSPAAVDISVGLDQFQLGRPVRIGAYHSRRHQGLDLNASVLGTIIPSDKLERVYVIFPIPLTVLLSIFIVSCLCFTMVTMSLFIKYCKQPEIKASSSVVSLCIFVGVYLLLTGSLIHTINSGLDVAESTNDIERSLICVSELSLFSVGLNLVLATLFAKTARIYHIFHNVGKLSKLWSDKGLFAAIFLCIAINIMIVVLWSAVDINHLVDVETFHPETLPPHYEVVQQCKSKYAILWGFLNYGYSVIFLFALAFVAFKTRKIKHQDYKDSKKINSCIVTLYIVLTLSVSLWFLLRTAGEYNISKVIISLAYAITGILCQVFLLIPKVIPSLKRQLRLPVHSRLYDNKSWSFVHLFSSVKTSL